jgi:hypothetical protein
MSVDYKDLDGSILTAINVGHTTSREICRFVEPSTIKLALRTDIPGYRDPECAVSMRLQAMRKASTIVYSHADGWSAL